MENALGGRFASTSHPKNGRGREGFGADAKQRPGVTGPLAKSICRTEKSALS